MAKQLVAALTEWFWSDLEDHGCDTTTDQRNRAKAGRERLNKLVADLLREHLLRYLRLSIMEKYPDAGAEEREELLRDNLPKLNEAIEFFGKSFTQDLQAEFVYMGEELDEKCPKDHKKYIARKIAKVSKDFFSNADDFAEDYLAGSPKAKRAWAQMSAALEPREITVRIPAGMVSKLERKARRMGYPLNKGEHLTLEDFASFILGQYALGRLDDKTNDSAR